MPDLFFRGPIRMRLNSGSYCVGQVPRMSHIATRPKKHVSDASVPRCYGLLQQAPPPVCSWLVVEGVLDVIRTRYLDAHTCSWTTLYSFFLFFGWFFQKNTRGLFAVVCSCCFFLLVLFFRVSFSAKVYALGPHDGCIISRKRGSLQHKTKMMIVLLLTYAYIRFKTGSGR